MKSKITAVNLNRKIVALRLGFKTMLRRALQKSVWISALAAGLFSSCSTDVDLLEEYKPITVVYGLLDVNDSIQYIKVNKAFLGEGNALVMAQQSDSVNYKPGEITVQLMEINPTTGEVLQIINCDTTTQILKDDGLFSNPYQILFKTTAPINQNSNYKVLVNRTADNAEISAVTPVVDSVEVTFPSPQSLIRFINNTGNYVALILRWNPSADAAVYTAKLRFTYYDSLLVAPFTKDTVTLELNLPEPVLTGLSMQTKLEGEDFYTFLEVSVSPNPNAIRWAEDDIEIIISAGAEDLKTYIEVNKPSIGIIQEKPTFTNITNGTGIFSSRWVSALKYRMDSPTTTKANEFLD